MLDFAFPPDASTMRSASILFEQLDIRHLAKQIAHGAFEQTATRKQSAYSRERQRRSPTSRRHQRRIKTEADARSPALIHQPVESGKQRLDFAPTAFDQGETFCFAVPRLGR